MVPRKRELLDVLRNQRKESSAHAPVAPQPSSVPSHSRSATPPWRGWILRLAFVLVWVALVLWLISFLWPDKAPPAAPPQAQTPATQTPPQTPPGAPGGANPAPAGNHPAAPADAPAYGVLAITYQGSANESQATAIALEMRDTLRLPDVQVRKHNDRGKTWYEIYVGREAEKSALDALLKRVRGLSLPSQPGQKPFADAFVKRIPSTT